MANSNMLQIRDEKSEDIDKIFEINKQAFGKEIESKIVDALREADELILSLVAEVDDEIIGHIAFSEVKIDSGERIHKAIGLGPMAILPEYQKKGFGSKLVQQGLMILAERGYEIVIVLGHAAFYPKFGFVRSQEYGIQWEHECPPEAFMVNELKPDALKGVNGVVYYSSKFMEQ